MAQEIHAFLEWVQLVVFVGLGLTALRHWRRQRNSTSGWLLATFGTLAVILVTARLIPEGSDALWVLILNKAVIGLLIFFPYALWRFTISILPRAAWFWWLAHILTAAALLFTVLSPQLPAPGEHRPTWAVTYIFVILGQFATLSSRVAWRLWRAGEGQPTVARRRMRTMSLGALGLATVLLISGTADSSTQIRALDVWLQLLTIATGGLFYLGFAPPAIVRTWWRRDEETESKKAERSLMSALTPPDIARALLPHVTHLTAGEGAVLIDDTGGLIGTYGLGEEKAQRLANAVRQRAEVMDSRPVLSVPLEKGDLAVLASPYTPFFGREETEMLTSLAVLADLALARADLFATQAATQERLEEAQSIAHLGSWQWFITTEEIKWSDEMYSIFGVNKDTFKPDLASYMDAVHEDDKERVAVATQKIMELGVAEETEHRIVRPDGEVRWVQSTTTLFKDDEGRPVRGIGTIQDITERKKSDEFRDQFIANAAHELRTPMTTLVGFVEMLTHGRSAMPEDRLQQIYDAMGRSGERLTVLISNLLDLSRLQQGDLNTENAIVDVKDVVDAALETTPPPDDTTILTDVDPGVTVCADKHRLLQVVSNLLTNAYRYGGKNIEITAKRSGDSALLSIADDGPGVEEAIVPNLFDPFARGSTSATVGGSGLGLAIVKALVQSAGGDVWHEKNEPHGARFCVRMEVQE